LFFFALEEVDASLYVDVDGELDEESRAAGAIDALELGGGRWLAAALFLAEEESATAAGDVEMGAVTVEKVYVLGPGLGGAVIGCLWLRAWVSADEAAAEKLLALA
jgi:hypothetical protein